MGQIKHIHDFLSENAFFQGMSAQHIKTLAGCGKLTHFKENEFLLKEGEVANSFYLIRSGSVAVECYVPSSGALSIARIGAGDITGYSWLFPPYRNSFDSIALSDVAAIELDGQCLRAKADQDHELGYHLMQRFAHIMLERLQTTRRQMIDVYATQGL